MTDVGHDPAAASRVRAEADRIEAAMAEAQLRLDGLAWHGPEAEETRARAGRRRRRAGAVAEVLRRVAAELEDGG
ncbi:MAG: hypothetical protein AAFN30_00110 [Actinomycetota bacterium]